MRRFLLIQFALAVMLAVASYGSAAQAQLLHTWVSDTGSDSANCDRPTPCASFSGAFGKTAAARTALGC